MKNIGASRLPFLVFLTMGCAFGYYHGEVAYFLDLWGISGKAPQIDAGKFQPVDRSEWKVHDVSTFESWNDDGLPAQAWDGNPETFWHSEWKSKKTKPPHHLAIDMGADHMVFAVEYVPRQKSGNGQVRQYELALSDDGNEWTTVAHGEFTPGSDAQLVRLQPPKAGRFLRINCLKEMNGGPWAAVAELNVLTLD